MPKGESLFRKRIAAKAAIGGMVANSKIGQFLPPLTLTLIPTLALTLTLTLALTLALTRTRLRGADAERRGVCRRQGGRELKLQHVEETLDSLAAAAGLEPSRVRPFLEEQGIQEQLDGPPGILVKIDLGVIDGSVPLRSQVEIGAGIEPANLPVNDARLKELMLEFQAAEAR
eukprot:scaffold102634_cov57-Phaeocystis_antarctica.AAC.2